MLNLIENRKKNIPAAVIIKGTIIGDIKIAIINALNGICGLLSPSAAIVPKLVARNVDAIPTIKLFLTPSIHLLVHTVVTSTLQMPNICLYHFKE